MKASYVLTEMFTAKCHYWKQSILKIFQISARSQVYSSQSIVTG